MRALVWKLLNNKKTFNYSLFLVEGIFTYKI